MRGIALRDGLVELRSSRIIELMSRSSDPYGNTSPTSHSMRGDRVFLVQIQAPDATGQSQSPSHSDHPLDRVSVVSALPGSRVNIVGDQDEPSSTSSLLSVSVSGFFPTAWKSLSSLFLHFQLVSPVLDSQLCPFFLSTFHTHRRGTRSYPTRVGILAWTLSLSHSDCPS